MTKRTLTDERLAWVEEYTDMALHLAHAEWRRRRMPAFYLNDLQSAALYGLCEAAAQDRKGDRDQFPKFACYMIRLELRRELHRIIAVVSADRPDPDTPGPAHDDSAPRDPTNCIIPRKVWNAVCRLSSPQNRAVRRFLEGKKYVRGTFNLAVENLKQRLTPECNDGDSPC